MKVDIPGTTLCCIACYNHELSIKALEHCLRACSFDKAIFITDREYVLDGIDLIKIPAISTKEQYSRFVLKDLDGYIRTDFVLMVQYDGFIITPEAWSPEFQNYDYIGAKWPWYNDGFNVGNGGFSLRSKRLLQALKDETILIDLLEHGEDTLICRTYRGLLEDKYGLKFAPDFVANRFSYERSGPVCKPFGFHGLFNMWGHIRPNDLRDFMKLLSPLTLGAVEAIELGMNYHKAGYLREAEIVYRRILEAHPGNEEALYYLKILEQQAHKIVKTGRNAPCPCGSGRKYKKCCGV